jgi:hypothetical protein
VSDEAAAEPVALVEKLGRRAINVGCDPTSPAKAPSPRQNFAT